MKRTTGALRLAACAIFALSAAACMHTTPQKTSPATQSEAAPPLSSRSITWSDFDTDEPSNGAVITWSQAQRDYGYRVLDQLSNGGVGANTISAGSQIKKLEKGQPLAIQTDIDAYLRDNHHSGIVILQDGKVRYENYGLKLDPTDRWTSFSVAKAFTSTLVGAAIKDGYIDDITDPLTKYIPELSGSAYEGVTIQHLITMSSGVAWSEIYDDPKSDVIRYQSHVPTPGMLQVVSYMRTLKRSHPPGTVWNYSTGETDLVGVLLINATGKTLSEYLSEKVWKPYGMEADATWLTRDPGVEISGCCLQARIRDFARYGQFMLEGASIANEQIVPENWVKEATKGRFDLPILPGAKYAYQWIEFPDGSFGHYGIFGQAILIDPKRKLVIASNASWADAAGAIEGQAAAREGFHAMVKAAIDAE